MIDGEVSLLRLGCTVSCLCWGVVACGSDPKPGPETDKTPPAVREQPDARDPIQDAARPQQPDARAMEAGPTTQPSGMDAQAPAPQDGGGNKPQPPESKDAMPPSAAASKCDKRPVAGPTGVRFHHIHYNTVDPAQDLEFFDKYFGVPAVDFCKGADGKVTRATKTERGWFLYTKVPTAPDPTLNTYLEHVGWIHPDPAAELQRLVQLNAPRYPQIRSQCESAFNGVMPCNNYWFYLQAPSGARIEVARGPGPATMGFGHIHMIMGTDYAFYETVSGGTFKNKVLDMVNHTDAALQESVLANETVVETRGKPIDHIGYSTTELEKERDRLMAAGIAIAEDISFKEEFGFRSFFVKSAKGVWVEMVEDTAFSPE